MELPTEGDGGESGAGLESGGDDERVGSEAKGEHGGKEREG